jgi:RecB family endonuclease NucS
MEGLLGMLEQGIELKQAALSPEAIARSRLVTNLSALEEGLGFRGEEVPVEAGKIDVLLIDKSNRFLVVELKREATDATIGQLLRLSASFAQQANIPPASIRKIILCARINDHVDLAGKSVNIEIRKNPSLFLQEHSSKTVPPSSEDVRLNGG